jgi:hypothetical protein
MRKRNGASSGFTVIARIRLGKRNYTPEEMEPQMHTDSKIAVMNRAWSLQAIEPQKIILRTSSTARAQN